MKKLLALLLALACVLSVTTAFAAGEDVKISVNGLVIVPHDAAGAVVYPKIVDGTTYLPVRAVATALGKSVDWDQATTTVYIDGVADEKLAADGKIKICVSKKQIAPVDANGKAVEPFIENGTTYLPVRAVATALGAKVDWNNDTRTVIIEQAAAATPEDAGVYSDNLAALLSAAAETKNVDALLIASDGAIFCEAYFGLYDADTALMFGTKKLTAKEAIAAKQGTFEVGKYTVALCPMSDFKKEIEEFLSGDGAKVEPSAEGTALLEKTLADIKVTYAKVPYTHKEIESAISGVWMRSAETNGYAISARLTFEGEGCVLDLCTQSGDNTTTDSANVALDGGYAVNRAKDDITNVEWEKGEWSADDTFVVYVFDPAARADVLSVTLKFASDGQSAQMTLAGSLIPAAQTVKLNRVENAAEGN